MAKVSLRNVTKVYEGKVTAIEDVILDVADGEFMVIVGPSGCGKTTTLRVIAGLEEITKGTIMIGDQAVNETPPKDRDVTMVFQNYALYPHMTVYQNMAFSLKLRKYSVEEIKKRITEAAMLLGIEHLLDRKPGVLSGGQRQRVAVGRAIVRNPKAFLFDEPLSNLDARLRVSTRADLKALHHRLKTTSIYVTHDQSEAMTLGDRICVMCNGVIQQIAPPLEVYDRPANKFVAGFLGMPPMNFFNGMIRYRNDSLYFIASNTGILLPARMKTALGAYKDQQVVLGIRPEHLSLHPINGQDENIITCTVTVVEPLGDRMDVYLRSSLNDKLIANVPSHIDICVDQPITTYLDLEKIHIFEPGEMGKNVSLVPSENRL